MIGSPPGGSDAPTPTRPAGKPGTPSAPGTPDLAGGRTAADGAVTSSRFTSTAPSLRQVWTHSRGLLLAAVVLLVAAVVLAVLRSDARHGRLDPGSADPLGSRAVAELLADQGVSTRTVTTSGQARAAVGPDTTLLVTDPDLLSGGQQSQLHAATVAARSRIVLIAPGPASIDTLAPEVTADSAPSIDSTLTPDCDLPAARRAGAADTGGIRYTTSSAAADSCYFSDGLPTLVHIPGSDTADDTVVLGAPDILFNDRLDDQGNASLALQLLGSRPHVVWYLPSLSDAEATDAGTRTFYDLVPPGWLWGAVQLAVGVALAALWRARRLGPLVPERLPVVIRASESTEGRARLYREAAARDRAAAALRTATRHRLALLTGTPPSHAHSADVLLPALSTRLRGPATAPAAEPEQPPEGQPGKPPRTHHRPRRGLPRTGTSRTGRFERGSDTPENSPATSPPVSGAAGLIEHQRALLFGPPPRDDAALIALADQLDALEGEVRRS